MSCAPPYDLDEQNSELQDWTSFHKLVQELIAGTVRRHTFSRWELDFLLDLEVSRLRKTSRLERLRKYLRTVHQQCADGAPEPMRFSLFLATQETHQIAVGSAK